MPEANENLVVEKRWGTCDALGKTYGRIRISAVIAVTNMLTRIDNLSANSQLLQATGQIFVKSN